MLKTFLQNLKFHINGSRVILRPNNWTLDFKDHYHLENILINILSIYNSYFDCEMWISASHTSVEMVRITLFFCCVVGRLTISRFVFGTQTLEII